MEIRKELPLLDSILHSSIDHLGNDFHSYRNHCYRMANFCIALSPHTAESVEKIQIAAGYHDLGIWTDSTFDYLKPSRQRAAEFLRATGRDGWRDEIESMIEEHHKLTKFVARPEWLTESFRKADWVDVSRGRLKFGLDTAFVRQILADFPNAGFHKRLVALTKRQFRSHPFDPLPMMKL